MTRSSTLATAAAAGILVVGMVTPAPVNGQPARGGQASHITIPFLANATRPADVEFEGGECDIDQTGNTMACQFQQVFLATSDRAPETCLVTTNRYERIFKKQSNTRLVSREGPKGVCGVVDVTTLQDDGGVKWTMETKTVVTHKTASPACRAMAEPTKALSWQNIRRALPCAFIWPGGIIP